MKKGERRRSAHTIEAAATGTAAGAVSGAVGGPAGVVLGAVLGGAVGAAAELEGKGARAKSVKEEEEIVSARYREP